MLTKVFTKLIRSCRKLKYASFSNAKNLSGSYSAHQPVVVRGEGQISFGSNVNFGVINSPMFLNSYAYIEARNANAKIAFGNNININNGFSIVSEKAVTIMDDVLMGYNCQISDSSFHNIDKSKRQETDPDPQEVVIGKNVFLGNNVTILKGVTIGENSVVANGSLVTKSCPANVVMGGVPAKVLKEI